MKKLFFVTVSIFLLNFSLSAQDIKFGVVGGANFSTLLGDFEDIASSERRLGFHVGVFGNYKISKQIVFSPRIVYSSQGFRSKGESVFPTVDFENGNPIYGTTTIGSDVSYILNYINIPILFKYYVTSDLSLLIGPQAGYLLNARYKGTSSIDGEIENENSKLNIRTKLDYGGVLGISYKLIDRMFLELKYYQGFYNTNRKEDYFIGGDIKNYNSVFQLSASYAIF